MPKDTFYFSAIKDKSLGYASEWKKQFLSLQRKRAGLLQKQTASQLLLSEDDLEKAFEKVKGVIPEIHHPVVLGFIAAPSGWNDAAAAFAECEWEQVNPLFDGLLRTKFNLAEATLEFFEELPSSSLSSEDHDYLSRLSARKTTESSDDDSAFYDDHRNDLTRDRKLKSAWDRFIFGRPIETNDFLAGIGLALDPLFNRAPPGTERKLTIRCDLASKHDFRNLNVDAGMYFAFRYAGLDRLFGRYISLDVGELFSFPRFVEEWKAKASKDLNRSTSKTATQLKFTLELETRTDGGSLQSTSIQLIWRFDTNAVASQLTDDWGRVVRHPFTEARTMREFATSKVRDRAVDLSDVKTFIPAYDRDRGSFVPAYKPTGDLAVRWRKNLAECIERKHLTAQDASSLLTSFEKFASLYGSAVTEFSKQGAGGSQSIEQLHAFSQLLETISTIAKGDQNRNHLLKPVLQLGVVPIEGGPSAAVIAPWHPMRLGAMWRKAHLVADLVRRLLSAQEAMFGDTRLFFRDMAQDLLHPFYPEVIVAWSGKSAELLVVTDTVQDYSLYEPPVLVAAEGEDVNENPTEGSLCVLDLVQRYLALHPHERANMSVVLFNCDSVRLPQAVIERVGQVQDDDEDFRCQVMLRHVDGVRLRSVYSSILGAETGADDFNPSESTQDFMARLRISVIADQAPPPDPKDGAPHDIVFSQDVISRHAKLEWLSEPASPADFAELLPSRWSRRRPAAADDLKSSVYLCCPIQSEEGWAYLSAVASVFKGDRDRNDRRRLLPTRQLDFNDEKTANIFQETHNLGNWVVNFDELLDRRQLLNHHVRVIRYKQTATQGRNLIISSSAPLNLLTSMIIHRLDALGLENSAKELKPLAERLIADANDVSGDIVLRAAKRGRSASELIGVVLSRHLIRDRLGPDSLVGWYFLDDYAAWIGQREEQLADLLAISPRMGADGVLRIALIVSEAKYVEIDSLAAKRKESQKQLRDTLRRIEDALFGEPRRLDRESWLARLADLMLDGVRVPAASGIDIGEWRRAMREGRCEMSLEGYSHVFVPSKTEGPEPMESGEVAGTRGAYQEVYGRSALRKLVLAFSEKEDTSALRRSLSVDHLDTPAVWRRLSQDDHTAPQIQATGGKSAFTTEPTPTLFQGVREDGAAEKRSIDMLHSQPSAIQESESVEGATAGWAYPAISQLVLPAGETAGNTDEEQVWLDGIKAATRSALQQVGLQAKLLEATLTPNSALLKFVGSSSMTVDQVTRKRSELLTTFGLNVISIRPEPGAIAIAVERPGRRTVAIEELWSRWTPEPGKWGNRDLLIAIRESDGSPLFLSPGNAHAPHTLIAGSTGSGKSVLMQNIILAIAATNTPEQARIVLIDPKQGVDYFAFEDLPHLDGGIIDDQEVATARLTELVVEMDRRYGRLKSSRCSNITEYNAKATQSERMPIIWVIHDEFAEWMLTEEYKESVSSVVKRLGVKARAAGIHLVFAAQRPDANVMPPQLRDNLGNRLILRVESEGTSDIALGQPGAERLLGRGHLLAKLEGERDLCYAQVPFVSTAFIGCISDSIALKKAAE